MRQRVALVQSLIVATDILIVDEPFSALDDVTRRSIVCQLDCWLTKEKIALVMVTHSFEDAAYLSDRAIFFLPGKVGAATSSLEMHAFLFTPPSKFTRTSTNVDFSQPEFTKLKDSVSDRYHELSGHGVR